MSLRVPPSVLSRSPQGLATGEVTGVCTDGGVFCFKLKSDLKEKLKQEKGVNFLSVFLCDGGVLESDDRC